MLILNIYLYEEKILSFVKFRRPMVSEVSQPDIFDDIFFCLESCIGSGRLDGSSARLGQTVGSLRGWQSLDIWPLDLFVFFRIFGRLWSILGIVESDLGRPADLGTWHVEPLGHTLVELGLRFATAIKQMSRRPCWILVVNTETQ